MNMDALSQELAGMDPASLAFSSGLVGAVATLFLVGGVLWFFISAFGYYKMFQKAGEAGWKAFIPVYSSYIRFKFAWDIKPFWIFLAALILSRFFAGSETAALAILSTVAGFVYFVLNIKLHILVAKSFGKSTFWGVMLFFFSFIVSMILGFGKAEYIGNTTTSPQIGARKH